MPAPLLLLCAAQFIVVLDASVVNIALPTIGAELGFAAGGLQYVISLYALTFGSLLILAGRAADLFGRRRMFEAGLVVFTLASSLCTVAWDDTVLLAGRALQGMGAAMLAPAALSLLTTLTERGPARDRALGAWGTTTGLAGAAGLLLGGVLTQLFGWPVIFAVNVPIGIACLLLSRRLLPPALPEGPPPRLDVPGAVLVSVTVGALVFGLTLGQQRGFTTPAVLVLLALAVAGAVAFVAVQRRVASPLVNARVIRGAGVAGALLAALSLAAITSSQGYFVTLDMQRVLGLSALETGLAFLPSTVLVLTGARLAARLADPLGQRTVLVSGLLVMALSMVWLSGVSARGTLLGDVLGGLTLSGLGLGLTSVGATMAATGGARGEDQGVASGLLTTSQQVGLAVGLAAIAAIAAARTDTATGTELERLAAGYSAGFLVAAGVGVAGAVVAALLVPPRSPRTAAVTGRAGRLRPEAEPADDRVRR